MGAAQSDLKQLLRHDTAQGGSEWRQLRAHSNCRDSKNLGDSVEIRIRDNGTGMPPRGEGEDEPIRSLQPSPPAKEPDWVMSISHDIIVKQHNGSIEVNTKPGAFTEFRIVLPRGMSVSKPRVNV